MVSLRTLRRNSQRGLSVDSCIVELSVVVLLFSKAIRSTGQLTVYAGVGAYGTLDMSTDKTAAYAAVTAIISKLDTFKKSKTRNDKIKTWAEMTAG